MQQACLDKQNTWQWCTLSLAVYALKTMSTLAYFIVRTVVLLLLKGLQCSLDFRPEYPQSRYETLFDKQYKMEILHSSKKSIPFCIDSFQINIRVIKILHDSCLFCGIFLYLLKKTRKLLSLCLSWTLFAISTHTVIWLHSA